MSACVEEENVIFAPDKTFKAIGVLPALLIKLI
jgi:hypothetical protein